MIRALVGVGVSVVFAAIVVLSSCTTAPGTARNAHFLQKGDELFLQEQYAQAAGHYDSYLASNPDDPRRAEIRLKAGKCALAEGKFDPALGSFDRALADRPPEPVLWELRFRRAVALLRKGEAARALEGFRAVAGAPASDRGRAVTDDELRFETALALIRTGDWKAGQAELGKVSPHGPYGDPARSRLILGAFTVQVGAFTEEAGAKSAALRARGEVRPVPTDKPLYLVTVGSFPRFEDAQREADRLKPLYPGAFVIP
jgi:tetratricopeptide (TPR) repeat protein